MAPFPSNPFVTPLLTDLYQITMAYAYFREGRHLMPATFDLFFRRNPFQGEYTVFAGLADVLRYLQHAFQFTEQHIEYIRRHPSFAGADQLEPFLAFLLSETCTARAVQMRALDEGAVCFAGVPLLRVDGPLAVCQLLETTLLTLVNYSTLVATNAARHRVAAGERVQLVEFGLRRAQGPDGGMRAARYAYLGGFDATSNVMAGLAYGIPTRGTHAHSFVQSYSGAEQQWQPPSNGPTADASRAAFEARVRQIRDEVVHPVLMHQFQVSAQSSNESELAAFVAYALAFPDAFLVLVDTYDTLTSGVPNFLAVALALEQAGHPPLGIRIDSGDLAHISMEARRMFKAVAPASAYRIFASSDLNEDTLYALREQGHSIDAFGIGTHLVTCLKQPALGCVYKLVQVMHSPRIKVSEEPSKTTVPGRKRVFRLFGKDRAQPMIDLMMLEEEEAPQVDQRTLCCHPFEEHKRCYMTPAHVEEILRPVWADGGIVPEVDGDDAELLQRARARCAAQVRALRYDYKRPLNPTPYKVSVTESLFRLIHQLWLNEAPIRELS